MTQAYDPVKLAAQLRQPSGEGALPVAERMAGNNLPLILQTYQLLQARPLEHILEVGPGNGAELHRLLEAVGHEGQVQVLDHSAEMVDEATRLNQQWVSSGRLQLHTGNLNQAPFSNQRFDAICSINTLYFWEPVEQCVSELWRLLKPGGRLALGVASRQWMDQLDFTQHGFTKYEPSEVLTLFETHGFELMDMRRRMREDIQMDMVTLVVRKPVS